MPDTRKRILTAIGAVLFFAGIGVVILPIAGPLAQLIWYLVSKDWQLAAMLAGMVLVFVGALISEAARDRKL